MKNIHIIPTEKPSSLYYKDDNYKLSNSTIAIDWYISSAGYKPTNIYITSDVEIKDSEIDTKVCIFKSDNDMITCLAGKGYGRVKTIGKYYEIILTTDEQLIKNGVQAIDDTFLEWFVKNPSCEWVDVNDWIDSNGNIAFGGNIRYQISCSTYKEIIIPQEELKTSEEWQKQFPNTKVLDPDGWDRKNYQYSWFEEKITLAEYTTRLHKSSVQGLIPQEEPKCLTKLELAKNIAAIGIGKEEPKQERICNCGLKESEHNVRHPFIPRQETLEEAAENWNRSFDEYDEFVEKHNINIKNSFISGAKWQAERSYNEAIEFAEWIRIKDFQTTSKNNWIGLDMKYYTTQELFKQFKKK